MSIPYDETVKLLTVSPNGRPILDIKASWKGVTPPPAAALLAAAAWKAAAAERWACGGSWGELT